MVRLVWPAGTTIVYILLTPAATAMPVTGTPLVLNVSTIFLVPKAVASNSAR